MLQFFIGLTLGSILGVCLMCVLFAGSEEDRKLGMDDMQKKSEVDIGATK